MATGKFIDYAASKVMQQQLGELYERMYPYAAEDFANHKDNQTRQDNINKYVQQLHGKLNQFVQQFNTHIHQANAPFSPTNPPIQPVVMQWPSAPMEYKNTTGSSTNLSNQRIPFEYFSYTDTRNSMDKNVAFSTYRRGKHVDINTGGQTVQLIRR